MDTVNAVTRSRIMRAVPRSDTVPELRLRHALHRIGMRYRLHDRTLPGSPDIVFAGPRVAVFVHGCYWHRHQSCQLATTPKSNEDFWQKKFRDNVARDRRAVDGLEADGWEVVVVWQCEVLAAADLVARRISSLISQRHLCLNRAEPMRRAGHGA
ncbi:MAG: DNA mismatch endonuclease Vsr [Comamonadaceae bacterium]|nr:MAG: DNA mismatch endonuclease Vsr [Comamonadaceae bacterium]